jgi:hypothetical protein
MIEGNILKMKSQLNDGHVQYHLPMGDELVDMNALIGKRIKFSYKGQINCIATGEKISKSYNQGYSYKSFISLARCDMCIMKPETCHFDKGTCREPEWGEKNCFIPHYVYLANTGSVKVGITRYTQTPTRWIDQGAEEALPILEVKDRKTSGLLEVEIKNFVGDKTNWRNMLKGNYPEVDLYAIRDEIFDSIEPIIDDFDAEMLEEDLVTINFPIEQAPEKVKSMSFDKLDVIEGVLQGIKGQYLIFDCGVVNMRKHQGYYLYLES